MNIINEMHDMRRKRKYNAKDFRMEMSTIFNRELVDCVRKFVEYEVEPTSEAIEKFKNQEDVMQCVTEEEFRGIYEKIVEHKNRRTLFLNESLRHNTNKILLKRIVRDMMQPDCESISVVDYDFLLSMAKEEKYVLKVPRLLKYNLDCYTSLNELNGILHGYNEGIDRLKLLLTRRPGKKEGEKYIGTSLKECYAIEDIREALLSSGIRTNSSIMTEHAKYYEAAMKKVEQDKINANEGKNTDSIKQEMLNGSCQSFSDSYTDIGLAVDRKNDDPAILRSGYYLKDKKDVLMMQLGMCNKTVKEMFKENEPLLIKYVNIDRYYNDKLEIISNWASRLVAIGTMFFTDISTEERKVIGLYDPKDPIRISPGTSGIEGLPVSNDFEHWVEVAKAAREISQARRDRMLDAMEEKLKQAASVAVFNGKKVAKFAGKALKPVLDNFVVFEPNDSSNISASKKAEILERKQREKRKNVKR